MADFYLVRFVSLTSSSVAVYQSSLKRKKCFEQNTLTHDRNWSLPSGNIFWIIALLCDIIVDLSNLAAQVTGIDTIQADIESLTVSWVGEFRMSNGLAVYICTFNGFRWAFKTVFSCS